MCKKVPKINHWCSYKLRKHDKLYNFVARKDHFNKELTRKFDNSYTYHISKPVVGISAQFSIKNSERKTF